MKKFIAIFMSLLMAFSMLGIVASATDVVGCDEPGCNDNHDDRYDYGDYTYYWKRTTEPTTEKPSCPCSQQTSCTQVVYNITVDDSDPTTITGFLYRIIKTIVPYMYKLLTLFNFSFGFNNQCGCSCSNCCSGSHCGNNGCNCNGNGNGNNNSSSDVVIPSIIIINSNNGGSDSTNGGNGSGSGDSNDSNDSGDSNDSNGGLLSGLFGGLFA